MDTHKMQLYFPGELYLHLKALATQRRSSIAAVVREAAQKYCVGLKKETPYGVDSLDAIAGRCRAKERGLSEGHDEILYGWSKSKKRSRK